MTNISNCDEARLNIAQEARAKFAEARRLAADGQYESALTCYLFAFDNGRYVSSWGGVRLSYIPSEIADLGKHLPAALKALRERRDAREKLILTGISDRDALHEWLSLNRYLGENERMLALLDSVDKKTREDIIEENFEELIAMEQYKIAAEVLDEFGRRFFMWECEYESELYFPSEHQHAHVTREQFSKMRLDGCLRSGFCVFAVALAVKRTAVAEEIARRLLSLSKEPEAYLCLILVASRLKSKAVVRRLTKAARMTLSKDEFQRLGDMIDSSEQNP